jgi:hypothetical protein
MERHQTCKSLSLFPIALQIFVGFLQIFVEKGCLGGFENPGDNPGWLRFRKGKNSLRILLSPSVAKVFKVAQCGLSAIGEGNGLALPILKRLWRILRGSVGLNCPAVSFNVSDPF